MKGVSGLEPIELRTHRLVLREFDPDDVDAIAAYQSTAAYQEHNGRAAPTRAQVAEFVTAMVAWRHECPRTRYQLVITHKGRLIGTCGVRQAHPGAEEAEYGCELAPDAWGHGYAREASRAILDFGIQALRLRRVRAVTQPGNAAAIRLAESLGFRCAPDGHCVLTPAD